MKLRRKPQKKTRKNKKDKYNSYKHNGGQLDNDIPICIYAHSDTFDVLEIQFEYLAKLFNNTSQKIYLFTNKTYNNPTLLYETKIYNDSLPYNKRILHCINDIKSDYFIISQESDILLNYSKDIIKTLANTMKTNNIDSVDLKQRDGLNNEIKITDTLSLVNISNEAYTYNVQPRLWKTKSAITFYSKIPDKTYKNIESEDVEKYIKDNQNTYGIYSKNVIFTTRFSSVVPEYTYLHITGQGKYLTLHSKVTDTLVKKEYNNIFNKYMKKSSRGLISFE
jgi:hypothetical protein